MDSSLLPHESLRPQRGARLEVGQKGGQVMWVAEVTPLLITRVEDAGPPLVRTARKRLEPAAQYEDGHGGHRTELVMRGSLGMGA